MNFTNSVPQVPVPPTPAEIADTVSGMVAPEVLAAPVKTITFNGTAGRGAAGVVPVWNVQGVVYIKHVAFVVKQTLTTPAPLTTTLSFGHAGLLSAIIGTTLAASMTTKTIWVDGTLLSGVRLIPNTVKDITVNENLVLNVAGLGANISGGIIEGYVHYCKFSPDGLLS